MKIVFKVLTVLVLFGAVFGAFDASTPTTEEICKDGQGGCYAHASPFGIVEYVSAEICPNGLPGC